MKTSPTDRLRIGIAAAALIAIGVPAIGQDVPESLLPPGFGDAPAPAPTPTPRPTAAAPAGGPNFAPSAPIVQPIPGVPGPASTPTPTASATPVAISPEALRQYELPDYARRSTASIGIAGQGGAFGSDAFGSSDGPWLQRIMRSLDAPVASRWVSIGLRRALVSDVATPGGVDGADYAAERAWLLVRMGEAPSARALVQSVDIENYTPKLFQIAMQAMLATGDPGGLCPLVTPAMAQSNERGWRLANAICLGLSGKAREAGRIVDQARRAAPGGGAIDVALAEKLVGKGSAGRREATIEWDGIDRLTAWRYGMAAASATPVPAGLFGGVGPQVRYWHATAPQFAPGVRLADADLAAAQGVVSSEALVDLYAQLGSDEDATSTQTALATDLRTAFTGRDTDRLTMLRQFWEPAITTPLGYARRVLTARAAAMIAPVVDHAGDADQLIASMLSAGLDLPALRWRGIVPVGSDGWAMLAVADPMGRSVAAGAVSDYAGQNARKGQLLFAALAGLGRLPRDQVQGMARELNVAIGARNPWTDAIDRAGVNGEGGTVLLLAATGMQTRDWRGVPAEALFHTVAALRAAGREGEARMIAAEALVRS
ncbi:hypothetical protein ACFQ15_07115 [Sphingomonas hankookensis]|uniref:hypothetical protein n=1 Tax=Sphingomonas hankookensis TaxID=563996 RepID=UPI001F56E327|nr:hypothetical protein [Sphingomonas hankookensis]